MRELKFKVWHKEMKQMFWFDLSWGDSGRSGSGWLYAVPWGEERKPGTFCTSDNREQLDPANCEIMQFTGLKDKDGKDIYEGDIVSHGKDEERVEKVVEWFQTGYRCGFDFGSLARLDYCEITGNIHENAEAVGCSPAEI